jgi:PIN domain nuclease of toxin-antitoxin system
MKSKVEVRADYIKRKCNSKGVKVLCQKHEDPIDFISITNAKGDMASVSENCATYESSIYAPRWTSYIENWARLEGFSEEQIKNQNLIRKVNLSEAIELLSS